MSSAVARMDSVWILISFVAIHHWPLRQLDIKNVSMAFSTKRYMWSNHLGLLLRGSLRKYANWKSPYMGWKSYQEHGFWRFTSVLKEFGLSRGKKVTQFSFINIKKRILLVIYVDDIMITRNNAQGIAYIKQYTYYTFPDKRPWILVILLGNWDGKIQERSLSVSKENIVWYFDEGWFVRVKSCEYTDED